MALTATVFNIRIELSDVDRGVYESFDVRIAQQPSETAEYMTTRLLAYALEYEEGIALSQGIAAADEPSIRIDDLTGRTLVWIEIGAPDADRLHRASKATERVAVYTHRDVRQFLPQLAAKKIHRAESIPIYAFDAKFIEELASLLDRRSELTISRTEGHLYVGVAGRTLETVIQEHHVG